MRLSREEVAEFSPANKLTHLKPHKICKFLAKGKKAMLFNPTFQFPSCSSSSRYSFT